ncbi:MAG: hypothetical protein ACOCRO_02285 [Halanaerobiales bacterium]
MKDRALYVNHNYIYYSNVDNNEVMTDTQVTNRVKWILKYAKELNYICPEFNWKRVAKDYFAIIEFESHFVNYWSMDDGRSTGITALMWSTAQGIADHFEDDFYFYENKNGKVVYNYNDRIYLRENVWLQIKYGMYYYYERLKDNLSEVDKNLPNYMSHVRRASWTEYNTGPGIDPNEERWRNYTFAIEGRISYHSTLLQEWIEKEG